MREPTPQELCHDRLGPAFEQSLSTYDTQRRVEVLVDDFLGPEMVEGKTALDVGCGLGYFSHRLKQRGALVTACDLGPGLVEATRLRVGCAAVVADALNLAAQFGRETFDLVVSSECIEHTPDPSRAVREMLQVLRPGGILSLSTPNLLWQPVVRLASRLKLRPFDGYENFSTFASLTRNLEAHGARVIRRQGLHLFPFQIPLRSLSRWCDTHLQVCKDLMIDVCVLGQKLD